MNSQITLQEPDGTVGIYLGNSAHDPLWFLEEWPGCWSVVEYGNREEKWSKRLYSVRTAQLADSLCNALQDYDPSEYDKIYQRWIKDRIFANVTARPYKSVKRLSPYPLWRAIDYRIAVTWDQEYLEPYECWVKCGYTYKCIGAYGDIEYSWERVELTFLPTGQRLPNVKDYATAARVADALSKVQGDFQFGSRPSDDLTRRIKEAFYKVRGDE